MASYLDSFNRTNANLESSLVASGGWSWTHDGAIAAALSIVSNQLQCNTFADPGTTFKAPALASADHYAQFKVVDITAAPGPFVCCRLTDKNNFIGFRVSNSAGNGSIQIFVNNANSYSSKYASGAGACANGDIIRLEVIGTSWALYKNGTYVTSGAIGTLTSASTAGLVGRVAAPAPWIDDFECGDILNIKRQGTPTEAATTSVTLPTHAAGDLILAFGYAEGSASITLPAGWTQIATRSTSGGSFRCGYKIAASSSETSGTWTNATSLLTAVYRGVDQTNPISLTTPVQGGANSATANYPALTPMSLGPSWVVAFAAHRSLDTAIDTAPAGLTQFASFIDANSELAIHDSLGNRDSWASTNVALGGTTLDWRTLVFEILAKTHVTTTAGAIAITGTAATVRKGKILAAGAGAIDITGTDAAVTKSGAAAKVLAAGAGAIAIAGSTAGVLVGRKVSASAGAIAVAGQAAAIREARRVAAAAGAVTIAGTDAAINKTTASKVLAAGVGAIVISGTDVLITKTTITPPAEDVPPFRGGPPVIYVDRRGRPVKRGKDGRWVSLQRDKHGRWVSLDDKVNQVVQKARQVIKNELPLEERPEAREEVNDLAAHHTLANLREVQETLAGINAALDRLMAEAEAIVEAEDDEDDVALVLGPF